jgi:hypothetical protein
MQLIAATMSVYRDFFLYREGIYQPVPSVLSRVEGYHSVRLIGWGEHVTHNKQTIKFWVSTLLI